MLTTISCQLLSLLLVHVRNRCSDRRRRSVQTHANADDQSEDGETLRSDSRAHHQLRHPSVALAEAVQPERQCQEGGQTTCARCPHDRAKDKCVTKWILYSSSNNITLLTNRNDGILLDFAQEPLTTRLALEDAEFLFQLHPVELAGIEFRLGRCVYDGRSNHDGDIDGKFVA